MIIDSSAILAILNGEADAERLTARLTEARERYISTGTLIEVSVVVLAREGEPGLEILQELLHDWDIEAVPVTVEHSRIAVRSAFSYGKGRHPAGLNLGRLVGYALAKATGT